MKNGRYRDVDAFLWFKDDQLHREDGPALEGDNGTCIWYFEGKYHRIDGPAMTWGGGEKEWWIHETQYSEEEFNHFLEKNELNKSLPSTLSPKPNIKRGKV